MRFLVQGLGVLAPHAVIPWCPCVLCSWAELLSSASGHVGSGEGQGGVGHLVAERERCAPPHEMTFHHF